jgi:tetratricopeptide (TPR) repeat protein
MLFIARITVSLLGSCILLTANPDNWMALHQLGSKEYAKENYARAEEYFSQALALAEQLNFQDSRLLANLNNLASTYTHLGDLRKAEQLFERFRPFHGTEQTDPDMTRALIESDVNHAAFMVRRGQPREALAEFERSLGIAERTFGPDDPEIAQICNHLALLYRDSGQYARARKCAERAVVIREREFGPKSIPTAASLSVLAQVSQSEGDLAQAEALNRRALAIRREASPGQSRVAESLSNLGTVVKNQGNFAEAERLYKEALHIWTGANGPASFEVALALNNLGSLYQQQGKLHKAEEQYRRAVPMMERAAGPASPSFALVLTNQSALYRELRKWDQAEMPLRRALAIDEAALGPEHAHVALDLIGMAEISVARKDYVGTESLLLRALAIDQRTTGKDSMPTAEASFHLAVMYQTWAKPLLAAPYFAASMEIWKVRAPADLEVATALEFYAAALKRNQQFADAAQVVTHAVGIRVQAARNGRPKAFPRDTMTSFR